MKKFVLILAISIIAAGAVFAQQLSLKEVITQSARGIEETLPQGTTIAIVSFASDSVKFSEYVIEEITSELLEGRKIPIVDRRNLALVREEMNLQLSGDVSDESAVSIGKMLGASYIITGTLTNMGTFHRFRIRIINVQTAAIQGQITSELQYDAQVALLLGGESAAQEFERQQQEYERTRPTSNVRNNWLSAEVSSGFHLWQGVGLGVGARYERMLNSKISLGVNFNYFIPLDPDYHLAVYGQSAFKTYLDDFDRGNIFGIDAFIRLYPRGRKFYLGIGLGYHDSGINALGSDAEGIDREARLISAHGTGFAATLDIGWKIDVGKEGGFFVQPGFLGTFIAGSHKPDKILHNSLNNPMNNPSDYFSSDKDFLNGFWRVYLGMGYAF